MEFKSRNLLIDSVKFSAAERFQRKRSYLPHALGNFSCRILRVSDGGGLRFTQLDNGTFARCIPYDGCGPDRDVGANDWQMYWDWPLNRYARTASHGVETKETIVFLEMCVEEADHVFGVGMHEDPVRAGFNSVVSAIDRAARTQLLPSKLSLDHDVSLSR